jgi:hypothetical protein
LQVQFWQVRFVPQSGFVKISPFRAGSDESGKDAAEGIQENRNLHMGRWIADYIVGKPRIRTESLPGARREGPCAEHGGVPGGKRCRIGPPGAIGDDHWDLA